MGSFRHLTSKSLLGSAGVLLTALALAGVFSCCARGDNLQSDADAQTARFAGSPTGTPLKVTDWASALRAGQFCCQQSLQAAAPPVSDCPPCSSGKGTTSPPEVRARAKAFVRTVRHSVATLWDGLLSVGPTRIFGRPIAARWVVPVISLSALQRCALLCRLRL